MMIKLFLIGFAGFIGTLGRYWLSGVVARRYGETDPLGLAVNLVGCFLVGLLFFLMQERYLVNQNARTIILIGLLSKWKTCFLGNNWFGSNVWKRWEFDAQVKRVQMHIAGYLCDHHGTCDRVSTSERETAARNTRAAYFHS